MALMKNATLFRRTRALETEIDEFLDRLSESALIFKHALQLYLIEGASEAFEERLHHASEMESEADQLRRSIEAQIYAHTLIPGSRGDVLRLLENLDNLLNRMEGTLWSFSIETPDIPDQLRSDYETLGEMAVNAVESIVLASRAFFRNIEAVTDHMHKVMFYEKEADKVGTKLKRSIFRLDLPLSHKAHLRDFVEHIDNIADFSEDVADRLVIYAIKRTV